MKQSNKTLIILYEIGHIDIVLGHFGAEVLKSTEGPIVVAIDYEIELALRHRGIPFYSMVDYSSRSSLKDRMVLVSNMMRQLHEEPEFSFFEYKGIKLGRIVGYSVGEYLLRILYHIDIFEYILSQFKDIEVFYLPESTIKVSSTVGQLAKFEIRAAVDTMTFLAQKHAVSLQLIPCPSKVVAQKKVRIFFRLVKRICLIWSIKLWNSIISLFRARGSMKIFVSDYWWHIDSFIKKMKGVELTMMERKEIRNAKYFAWRYKIRFNHPTDYSTYITKREAEEERQLYKTAWEKLGEHPNFSKQFVWFDTNYWEIVRPAYAHLVTVFSGKVVETVESIERLFKKQKIEAVILRASVSGQIHFSALGLVAHKMNIPAIELQHGLEVSKDYSLSAYKCADILSSYGPIIKKELEEVKGNNLRVLNVGSPRFDQYRNETISDARKTSLRKELNIDPTRPVLLHVATDIVLGQTHDTYSILRLFKSTAKALKNIKGLQIVATIRPGSPSENFLRHALREAFGDQCHVTPHSNMHELISISDIVASSFSTVTLEVMIARKPLILIGLDSNSLLLAESHFLPHEQAQAVRIARTEKDLSLYVENLLSNHDEATNLVNNADDFLKKNYCFDGKSAERTVDYLETLRKK